MDETISNSTTPKRWVFFSRVKRKFLRHVWLARIAIVGAFLVGIFLIFLAASKYAGFAYNFITKPADKVKSFDGRVNILVLGKAGPGHAGPDLTDTMIFVSVSLVAPDIDIISIPRDIWIPAIRAKINSAYYWGNQKEEGGGLKLAKSTVEEVVGQPVAYGLVIDFNGFKKIIDVVGGIDVNVENSFVDEKYPIAGRENDTCNGDPTFACRYETIKFAGGQTHMDGETALKFVRSRNAQGEEGTDLARGKRQDLVISAVRAKVLSPKVYLSISKDVVIWRALRESVETDLNEVAVAVLARRVINLRDHVQTHIISEDLLVHPPQGPKYDNQYVFIPKDGSWDKVHEWVSSLLKN